MTGTRTSVAKKPLRKTTPKTTRGKATPAKHPRRSSRTPKPRIPKATQREKPAQEDPAAPETTEEIVREEYEDSRTTDETEDTTGDVIVLDLDDDDDPIETSAIDESPDYKPTKCTHHAHKTATRTSNGRSPSSIPSVPVAAIAKIMRQLKPDNRKLPKFRGDVLEWPLFIKKYRRTTRELQIDNEENRERLEGALQGRAKRLVRDKLRDACLVERAIATLEQEYGGTKNLMKAALERVRKVKRLDADLRHINKFVRDSLKIELIVRECHSDGMEEALLNLMVDLLPGNAAGEWRNYQREINKPNAGSFTDFVDCIQRLEADYTRGQGDRSPSPEVDQHSSKRYRPLKWITPRNRSPHRHRTPPRVMHSRNRYCSPSPETDQHSNKRYRPLSSWQRTTQRNWTPPRNGSPQRHRTPPRVMHTRNRDSRYPDQLTAREYGQPRNNYAPPEEENARYRDTGYAPRRSRSRTPPRFMHTRRHQGPPAIEPSSVSQRNNQKTVAGDGPARRKTPPGTNEDRNCHMDCSSPHPLADCPKYKTLSDREKYVVRRNQRRCHFCLLGHVSRDCPELRT